jgi:tyrosine-protein phosphatase YwqE
MHSHLLPGIDDGVTTLEQSITCIRQLADWGIEHLITTPHISQAHYPNEAVSIRQGRDGLQAQLDQQQILVRLDVAAEYMLDESFLERLEAEPLLSFGTARYLLIETGWLAKPFKLDEILFRIQTHGYTPVLAHPERYSYYVGDPLGLSRLRDQGCLFQLNWMSLTGRYGPQARVEAKGLLRNKWVDFIGSDLHRPEDLPALQALFSSSTVDLLHQQPLRNAML